MGLPGRRRAMSKEERLRRAEEEAKRREAGKPERAKPEPKTSPDPEQRRAQKARHRTGIMAAIRSKLEKISPDKATLSKATKEQARALGLVQGGAAPEKKRRRKTAEQSRRRNR